MITSTAFVAAIAAGFDLAIEIIRAIKRRRGRKPSPPLVGSTSDQQ